MRSVIILPTYNERENLAGLAKEIFAVGIPDLRVIIVDDNSPDGTGQVADQIAIANAAVSVIHRPAKAGLGQAYLAGFQAALADPATEYIFEMDADYSHQPKYLPEFLTRIQTADLVLGSRYMVGGGVRNWGWLRRYISWQANAVIRALLRMPIRDLTGGYKCFRREVLERIDLGRIESNGYNFQIEVTYRTSRQGFRIAEIPIVFIERRAGRSKFSVAIMLESFWKVLTLRFGRSNDR